MYSIDLPANYRDAPIHIFFWITYYFYQESIVHSVDTLLTHEVTGEDL